MIWSRESILAAIREWAEEQGGPPLSSDWRAAGYGHPSSRTVALRFGTWNDAIAAAGFTPVLPGKRQRHALLAARVAQR